MDIVIVDDEPLARHRLRCMVTELGHEVLAEAGNGEEAEAAIRLHDPSLVLLDIAMPGEDGLQLAARIARDETPPAIIFTTAYDQHALAAFDTRAAAYLLKPVNRARLEQALEKAGSLSKLQRRVIDKTSNRQQRHRIPVKSHGGVALIALEDIRYFRADHKYVVAISAQGEALMDKTLQELEKEFAGVLIRVHRNALVAIAAIQGLSKDSRGHWRLQLADIVEQPAVSKRYIGEIKSLMNKL